jgi:hypothetical protein
MDLFSSSDDNNSSLGEQAEVADCDHVSETLDFNMISSDDEAFPFIEDDQESECFSDDENCTSEYGFNDEPESQIPPEISENYYVKYMNMLDETKCTCTTKCYKQLLIQQVVRMLISMREPNVSQLSRRMYIAGIITSTAPTTNSSNGEQRKKPKMKYRLWDTNL